MKKKEKPPGHQNKPRKNWEKALKQMHGNGDDEVFITVVLDDDVPEEWN